MRLGDMQGPVGRSIRRMAAYYAARTPCERDDLEQSGWLAILADAAKFDPARGPAGSWARMVAAAAMRKSARHERATRRRQVAPRRLASGEPGWGDMDELAAATERADDPGPALAEMQAAGVSEAEARVVACSLGLRGGAGCGVLAAARVLGLSAASAHSAYYRAIRKLRKARAT